MLRRDITPEEFVRAVRMCAGPFAPWTDKAAADTEAVRALFETEETLRREATAEAVHRVFSVGPTEMFAAPTPPAGSEESYESFLRLGIVERDAHIDALRAEVERLKEEKVPLEACKWVLLALHESLGIQWGDDPYRAIDALRANLERVTRAIRWACGEGDSDFSKEMERATDPETGRAPFWWRTKLRRLAGLDAARTAGEGRDG